MNTLDARAAILAYIQADIPCFVWGAPGIGKSDVVASIAAELDFGLVDERLSTLESVDLRGLPTLQEKSVVWAVPAMFEAIRAFGDRPVILFLDELVNASPSMQAATYQLILNRRIGPHVLGDNVRIVAAGNRQSDRAAANRMPSALANRFAHVDVEADAGIWRAWAERAGIHPMVCAFIGFRPNLIHDMKDVNARAFPTPRSWVQVAKIANAPEAIRPALVAGLVGQSCAAEFEAFIQIWSRVPKLATIVADPDGAPVASESDPALLYATSVMLSRGATRQNFAAIVRYVERMPQDLAATCIIEATKRDATLINTPAFIDWAARNSDISV